MESVYSNADKRYFIDMVDDVRIKIGRLEDGSLIKRFFPDSRLEQVLAKIDENAAEALEWERWQPPFLFLRNSDTAAIQALDDDLRLVCSHSSTGNKKTFEFLESLSEDAQPWAGGIFEVFVKAAMLRGTAVSNVRLDTKLSNGRRPDIAADICGRNVRLECTSLCESRAGNERWRQHVAGLQADCDSVFSERQDAYTQGRRLYAKVFEKIAPGFDLGKSQMGDDGPNLLLISLNATISDLAARSPSIGWALDELFASQPNGNRSPVSLCEWLLLQRKQKEQSQASLEELLAALGRVSGILVFDGCTLGSARINYNAHPDHMLSHTEMAVVERLLAVPPLYAR